MNQPPADLRPLEWGRYATLADVLPAVDDAFRGEPSSDVPIPPSKDVVLMLIDGLGDELLTRHADVAPTLTAMRTATIRAGFPATTATSITSLMAGVQCGSHGIIGYSFRTDRNATRGPGRQTLNALRWTLNRSDGRSALETYAPESVQPLDGSLADMARRGVEVSYVMPLLYRGSGFSRAAFRVEGSYVGAQTPDEIRDGVGRSLANDVAGHRFVYAYWPDLDAAGHLFGPGSPQWVSTLAVVDRLVADLAADLPRETTLLVTGDHGMIQADKRIDIDTTDEMLKGVEAVAGEMRVRQVYTRPGARDDVQSFWTDIVGEDAHVVTHEQVLDERWFGDEVTDFVDERIGDLVVVARGTTILTRSLTEPEPETTMLGHHGAWTFDEQLVPLLVQRG
ncbi:alkaline phosphatase family protein [Gordonia sp. CPCC 206044]|uniref:alkaline phosphatase family protein n=1 Tax=Gordonia sp. CPCC 206044 TaxID=3140793 RepID=UPI003AF3A6E8